MVTVLTYFASFYFSHAYVGQDYSIQKNVGKISLEQIDSVSCTDHRLHRENLLKDCCQSSEWLESVSYFACAPWEGTQGIKDGKRNEARICPLLHVGHLLLSVISFQGNHFHYAWGSCTRVWEKTTISATAVACSTASSSKASACLWSKLCSSGGRSS